MTDDVKPKYPPRFAVGEEAIIAKGAMAGRLVTVLAIEAGYPYAKYRLKDEEGEFSLGEHDLGKYSAQGMTREGNVSTRAMAEGRRVGKTRE